MEAVSDFEAIRRKLLEIKKPKTALIRGLSTGSTLLNLACSSYPDWGFALGTYVFLVGDSVSGKTFLSLTCLAEAARSKRFADYRFVYDNVEGGAMMDIQRFFGGRVAERLESPGDGCSTTIEEFYYHLDDALAGPCIYVLDSMDSLTTEDEDDKFAETKKAHRNGRQVSGNYGTSKAKANSANIRRIIPKLRETRSILIVISQTRDNIGFGSQFQPKIRSGGHALRFYANLEIWSSVRSRIKKTVSGKDRQLGIICKAEVKKNRLTGRERTVEIPILHSYGIDDLGSCVDFLVGEGHWKKGGSMIEAKDLGYKAGRDRLIEKIEEDGRERELRELVAKVWEDIESACEVKRKNRYE